jgi:hypothetical protein
MCSTVAVGTSASVSSPAGAWVSYGFDGPDLLVTPHPSEISALRYALDTGRKVVLVPWHTSLNDVVDAAEHVRGSE